MSSICNRLDLTPESPSEDSVVGFAINSFGKGVLSGLRHPIEKNSNGWYIWFGEYSEEANFFSPICTKDMNKYLSSSVLEYLDLPIGYRFLLDNKGYEDVWYDEELLNI